MDVKIELQAVNIHNRVKRRSLPPPFFSSSLTDARDARAVVLWETTALSAIRRRRETSLNATVHSRFPSLRVYGFSALKRAPTVCAVHRHVYIVYARARRNGRGGEGRGLLFPRRWRAPPMSQSISLTGAQKPNDVPSPVSRVRGSAVRVASSDGAAASVRVNFDFAEYPCEKMRRDCAPASIIAYSRIANICCNNGGADSSTSTCRLVDEREKPFRRFSAAENCP